MTQHLWHLRITTLNRALFAKLDPRKLSQNITTCRIITKSALC
jgi:hypothetical protein